MSSRLLSGWGRALLGGVFVLAAVSKLMEYDATLVWMGEAGLGAGALLLPAAIGLEIAGGLAIIAGSGRIAAVAALALAAFTLVVNYYFHPFWALTGREQTVEASLFFKNIAIVGGLAVVAAGR